MLSPRLYRAAMVPVAIALAIAAFSLGGQPAPLTSTLAPDAFEGARALSDTRELAAAYPERRAGSAGDSALARHIAQMLEGLGGSAGGGFAVRTLHTSGQTLDGERELETVIATRPGSTGAAPIVVLAHRDAAARGSVAELSATGVLIELARVFASRETKRTIVLASTSGGSGGDAGAQSLLAALPATPDAAIVLGDLAAPHLRGPLVIPYSDGLGGAPPLLTRTLSGAIAQQIGSDPGSPSALGQLAHLAFPLAVGEQGVLEQQGVPAVLVQASGEHGPSPTERLSGEHVEALGRAVLNAVDALDAAPNLPTSRDTSLLLARKTLPAWAARLVVLMLLLAPLLVAADGLARARRRRMQVGRSVLWALSCSLPFLTCAVFLYLLAEIGIVGSAPTVPVPAGALPFDGSAAAVVVAAALTFALAWLLWRMLLARLRWSARPDAELGALAALLVLIPIALLVWVGNPFAALLLVPAAHVWLLLAAPELRLRRAASLLLVAAGLVPALLLGVFYAHLLALSPGETLWTAVLLLAGGHVGLPAVLLWSIAAGCMAATAMAATAPAAHPPRTDTGRPIEVTIRGPLSYAGPGSLGGTESALRR
jgi:hypothetical protein